MKIIFNLSGYLYRFNCTGQCERVPCPHSCLVIIVPGRQYVQDITPGLLTKGNLNTYHTPIQLPAGRTGKASTLKNMSAY